MNNKLLTIAVPTYNRSAYLDTCLSHITRQLCDFGSLVEIIVSDNCSADNTREIVQSYVTSGIDIHYIKNAENIGADRNFVQCFNLANGKYVLILGDDDILLDGALAKILSVLGRGDYGVVHLNSYGFSDNFQNEMPASRKTGTITYSDPARFLRRVSYWITFASGNIFNKSLLGPCFDPATFSGTHLVQVDWYMSAIVKTQCNAVVEDYLVAAKSANTGGYDLCEVFGKNLSRIFESLLRKGVQQDWLDIINRKLLREFFPHLILIIRGGNSSFDFQKTDFNGQLQPLFGKYLLYWLVTFPAIKLPRSFALFWCRGLNFALNRVAGVFVRQ